MKTIGERIREKREELGLSQAELGERLGVSNVAVAHTEADRGNITMSRVKKYADALHCDLNELTQEYEEQLQDRNEVKRGALRNKSYAPSVGSSGPREPEAPDNAVYFERLTPNEHIIVERYRDIPEEHKSEFLGRVLAYTEKLMNGELS